MNRKANTRKTTQPRGSFFPSQWTSVDSRLRFLVITHLDQYQPIIWQRFQSQQQPSERVLQRYDRNDRSVLRIPRVPRVDIPHLPFSGGAAVSEEGPTQAATKSARRRPAAGPERATH